MTPRICIVGVGSIGSRHIDNLLAMGYQDLVGVETRSMPDDERLPIVENFEELSTWKPTHALICTPPQFHYDHAWRFLERGIPTFLEKPMTTRALESATLTALAKNTGTYTAVGYMERAHPVVRHARNWAEAHRPDMAHFFCYWKATAKTYGLDVVQESSHAVDTALYVMGEPQSILRRSRGAVRSEIELKHAAATVGTSKVVMDMDASPRRRIQLWAKQEAFSMDYGTTPEEWDACYKDELQAFLDGTPLCTGEDGAKVMQVLEQLR